MLTVATSLPFLLLPPVQDVVVARGRSDDGRKAHGDLPAGIPWAGYYAGVEGLARAEWDRLIWPRIQGRNFRSVLEISPGGGRWSEMFKHLTNRYIGVDLNAPAIAYLKDKRFANATNLAFHVNDGRSLPMVANRSITFVFSWDSMVHFPPAAIRSYIAELARVLRPGGTAFLHHANLRVCNRNDPCPGAFTCTNKNAPQGPTHVRGINVDNVLAHVKKHPEPLFKSTLRFTTACGVAVHAHKNPHARNAGTTCESVAAEARIHELIVVRQEQCNWPWCAKTGHADCLTALQRPARGAHSD